jgi:RNA polymerase sigma-70 factor, ECF subfamily
MKAWGKRPFNHVNPRAGATLYTQLWLIGTDVAVVNRGICSQAAAMGHSATLSAETGPRCAAGARQDSTQEDVRLNAARALDQFLSSVERRAFRIASIALRDPEEALDVVQDAMLQLARRYGSRPADEWMPLFYRILQNRIRDSQRRKTVRGRIFAWWPGSAGGDESADDPALDAADSSPEPDALVANGEALRTLESAVAELPARQSEAFLLRTIEGLDVAATAAAMGCSEGSVKTHYSRAVHTLRARLGEAW